MHEKPEPRRIRTSSKSPKLDRSSQSPRRDFGLFPVVYSTLAPDALLAEITHAYAVSTPVACQLLKRGLNDTYLVTTEGERYIARVYRARWRTVSEIAYELELLTHLAARGVPVSAPIVARDGRLTRPLAAPEGTRHLVLFTYARGRPLSWQDEEHCYLAGRVLASVHAGSDDFVSQHSRFCLDLEYLIDRPLAAIRPFLVGRSEDWAYLEAFAARVRNRAAAIGRGLDWGVCHGDFGAKNVFVAEDHEPTLFDFDLCGPGWRAYDIAIAQWVAMDQQSGRIWETFLRGYAEVRPLPVEDLRAIPLFHAVYHLSSLGVFAEIVADSGILDMSDWYLDRELEFFRRWETEPLGR